jgi:hypothetical protein
MDSENYFIKISPEVLSSDIVQETLSGNTFGVYSGMSEILSGGTDGSSLLTGLTIPLMFTQTYDDMGYFTPFDGLILQKDVITNFLYKSSIDNPYLITLYNTSQELEGVSQFGTYTINWGDGTRIESFTMSEMNHSYPNINEDYIITMTQVNPWGVVNIKKPVSIPQTGVTITNPEGTIDFTSKGGNWSGTPTSYNFIFSGDSVNTVERQISSNSVNVPFIVSGFTKTQINALKGYGLIKYDPARKVYKDGEFYGQVLSVGNEFTEYTINNIDYYDYPNGRTLYIVKSSGLTSNDLIDIPIIKDPKLMGVVNPPEIQSEIFIERGKNSAFEGLQRLGEVDNLGDLTRYGFGFFKINEQ